MQALQCYAQHFGTVEGNSSFYGVPPAATLQRWLAHTPDHFEFCFKMPRQISHDAPLLHGKKALLAFLHSMQPVQHRHGLLWLQLSHKLGPESLPALAALLAQLPTEFQFGLEVRHPAFFTKGDVERRLNALLMEHDINRVMFDTRTLFAEPCKDTETREAQRKKPRVPLHVIATGDRPMLRFISPLDTDKAEHALQQWAAKVSDWVSEGKRPLLFFHTPDNVCSPDLAHRFATLLQQALPDFQPPPPWPRIATQPSLFD